MSAWAQMLDELETMAKAMPATDDLTGKQDGQVEDKDPDDLEGKQGEGNGGDGDIDDMLGKSFVAVIDGEERQAMDGTQLVKALMARVDASEGEMTKAMGAAVSLIKVQGQALKAQTDLIKSLQADVARIGAEPGGRKSALSVHDKAGVGDLAKSEQPTLDKGTVLAKANAAFDAKRLTGRELHELDTALRLNVAPDPVILAKALA